MKVAFSPIYRYHHLPAGHRFPMEKYDLLPQQLLYEGVLTEKNFFHPKSLSEEQILRTHTAEYWHKLNTGTLSAKEIRNTGFPFHESLVTRGRHIAHGTFECALHALRDGVALNIAGGTHHAYADRGEGFCIFNDIAIASNELLHLGLVNQILVVDLDVHQGNGTAKIFENEPRVFTFSMHCEHNYPLQKEHSDLDIGLKDQTGDEEYLEVLQHTLPALIEKVNPQMIFFQSGVDVIATDKLGRLAMTRDGCKKRDEMVFSLCKAYQIPVAVSMGGGYSHRIADIVAAHANTFKVAQELYF
ncbi:histone deacetylase [Reichenbachiella agarivorans]|uniref:Histone deacetylase n=1 Tax=Reichenbachiella agarivorans TaxID=2979464 RepID=A0ABY6CP05_9BACT|nr:histone deacetylase [Reichenbachiella agarivorans]UXP31765.1 histone deacetylase [Reichenbachiella agarivorans]